LKLLPDEKSVWILAAARAARRLASERKYDVLVSFAQPWSDHLAGLRVHRATGLPWVAHFSDPWVDSPYLRGRGWQRRIWTRMEADVVREADALVFVNEHTAERVMRKYPDAYRAKTHVVPHGYDPSERAGIRPAARDDRLTLVHTGRFYDRVRTPEALLRALAALNRRRPIGRELRVVFVGTPIASHPALASALGLSASVEFVGRVSAEESAGWAQAADVLLVIDAPADENLFLPSKLVDYLVYRKPILGLTPPCGASADLLRALGYPVIAPDDEDAIASAIDALLTAAREGPLTPAPGHDEAASAYHIARTTDAFARVLERCA
jgi:glycosyltransferase involved in cell wall biosynthesis